MTTQSTSGGRVRGVIVLLLTLRFVPESQRNQVGSSGFSRWLDEMRDQAGVWVDSEFNATGAGAAG